jgi:hypothetical protein
MAAHPPALPLPDQNNMPDRKWFAIAFAASAPQKM